MQAFAKKLGPKGDIIAAAPGRGPITGSERRVIIIDPPTYGVSVSKSF